MSTTVRVAVRAGTSVIVNGSSQASLSTTLTFWSQAAVSVTVTHGLQSSLIGAADGMIGAANATIADRPPRIPTTSSSTPIRKAYDRCRPIAILPLRRHASPAVLRRNGRIARIDHS